MADLKHEYSERTLGISCVVERLGPGFFRVIAENGRNDLIREAGGQRLQVGDVGRTVYYSDSKSYGLVKFVKDPTVGIDFEKAKKNYPYGWKDGWPGGERSLEDKIADAEERSADGYSKDAIDLSEYEFCSNVDSHFVYRKIVKDENGEPRGIWAARHQDGGEPFAISYAQARGFEPIDHSPIKQLARQLGEMLLP